MKIVDLNDVSRAYYIKKIINFILRKTKPLEKFIKSLPQMSELERAAAIGAFIQSGRDVKIDEYDFYKATNSVYGVRLLVYLLCPDMSPKDITKDNYRDILQKLIDPNKSIIKEIIEQRRKLKQNGSTSFIT